MTLRVVPNVDRTLCREIGPADPAQGPINEGVVPRLELPFGVDAGPVEPVSRQDRP